MGLFDTSRNGAQNGRLVAFLIRAADSGVGLSFPWAKFWARLWLRSRMHPRNRAI